DARHADREVRFLVLRELLYLLRGLDLLGERLEILRAQRRHVEREQVTMHAQHRWTSDFQVQIGRAILNEPLQNGLEVEGRRRRRRRRRGREVRGGRGRSEISHWGQSGRGPVRIPRGGYRSR